MHPPVSRVYRTDFLPERRTPARDRGPKAYEGPKQEPDEPLRSLGGGAADRPATSHQDNPVRPRASSKKVAQLLASLAAPLVHEICLHPGVYEPAVRVRFRVRPAITTPLARRLSTARDEGGLLTAKVVAPNLLTTPAFSDIETARVVAERTPRIFRRAPPPRSSCRGASRLTGWRVNEGRPYRAAALREVSA